MESEDDIRESWRQEIIYKAVAKSRRQMMTSTTKIKRGKKEEGKAS